MSQHDLIQIIIVIAGTATLFSFYFLWEHIRERYEAIEEYPENITQAPKPMFTSNRITNINKAQESVLNRYEQSNIRIPADIIEDLHYLKLDNEEDIFKFIEQQRNHWKLENNKKMLKR